MNEIPDIQKLTAAVLSRSSHPESTFHGEHHWQCVSWTGLQLAAELPECDPLLVFLFGLFHDSQRVNDDWDPDHGRRAAELVGAMHGELFRLEPERLERLQHACRLHADGHLSEDPTAGACWDADRLNLWRVGIAPNPRYLSTAPARRPEVIQWAGTLQSRTFEWEAIFGAYAQRFDW